jgi:hypothetical protein
MHDPYLPTLFEAFYFERANAQKKHLAYAVEVTAYLLSCMTVEIHARSNAEGQDPDPMVAIMWQYLPSARAKSFSMPLSRDIRPAQSSEGRVGANSAPRPPRPCSRAAAEAQRGQRVGLPPRAVPLLILMTAERIGTSPLEGRSCEPLSLPTWNSAFWPALGFVGLEDVGDFGQLCFLRGVFKAAVELVGPLH